MVFRITLIMDSIQSVRNPSGQSLLTVTVNPTFIKFSGGSKEYKGEALILDVRISNQLIIVKK